MGFTYINHILRYRQTLKIMWAWFQTTEIKRVSQEFLVSQGWQSYVYAMQWSIQWATALSKTVTYIPYALLKRTPTLTGSLEQAVILSQL